MIPHQARQLRPAYALRESGIVLHQVGVPEQAAHRSLFEDNRSYVVAPEVYCRRYSGGPGADYGHVACFQLSPLQASAEVPGEYRDGEAVGEIEQAPEMEVLVICGRAVHGHEYGEPADESRSRGGLTA